VRVLNQLYSEIDKKQALANYGEMCGDITHEIPKYFQIILNAVHLLHTDLKKERDPLKRLDTIREATLDGNSRLETLKKLFKDTKQLGKGKTSVAQAIDRTLKKFDVSNLTTVTCVTDIPNNLPVWPLTSDQSQTCISILLQNACESIRDAGRTDGRIEIKAHWESPKLSLTVTDNGGGFAPEHHADLFEVGFSTKPYFSDRMGLGLSLVRRIVNGHNGTIEAKSDFGHGAVFQIEFTIDLSPAR
jgi:signal transduction histidine kinase